LCQRRLEKAFLIGGWLLRRRWRLGVVCLLRFGFGLGLWWRFGHLRELLRPRNQAEP
jgi:hypothetical protein